MPLPLETKRLLIRPFEPEDAAAAHLWLGDPEVMARIPSGASGDVAHTASRLQVNIDHQRAQRFSLWAVAEKRSGKLIGDCGLFLVEGKGPEVEIIYRFARKYQRQGYAAEAAREVLRYGREELRLPKIIAITHPDHHASRRVMEKCGMIFVRRDILYGIEMVVYEF